MEIELLMKLLDGSPGLLAVWLTLRFFSRDVLPRVDRWYDVKQLIAEREQA